MNTIIKTKIELHSTTNYTGSYIILSKNINDLSEKQLTQEELKYIKDNYKEGNKVFFFNRFTHQVWVQIISKKADKHIIHEELRKEGAKIQSQISSFPISEILLIDLSNAKYSLFYAEGIILSSYTFDKYKSKKEDIKLSKIFVRKTEKRAIELMNISNEATFWSRNLLNEPQMALDAQTITEQFKLMGKDAGFKIEVLSKKKIESLKMGGLLAVNKGSNIPPSFSIMEWKPENAINSKPYIFVGKGVVYDTGGVNIKTGDFMTNMHMDMGGAAAASTAIFAIAKAKLPVHVICLIPATDNRPGQDAYTPGDIITMYNGMTVEVLNTDAEGRLILADALSYAKKYDPLMVIDLATLTGAAARAIGKYGIVAMRNNEADISKLNKSSENVFERLVEFPMWDEYDELIKTDVADMKNLGGAEGGAITAGKFLQNYVDYPWIHLDIAGPAMLSAKDSYRTKGGSGVGTRLLFDFIKELAK
ncbi:MAG: leucyl aminopeptidase [Bacteroidales bacterium]|nr:leucyl aminopeptidase [Bacteroidales bacterium]